MTDLARRYEANTRPGPHFVSAADAPVAPSDPPVRLIAYYLPQFHAVPENDAWWGRGFTEWTNVTKALPRYDGHYQPRLPADLGFYDLSTVEALRRQAELARRHGIGGFCIHHYWFGGRRLLQRPLELLLANPQIDMPFCLNWANENWTRRWDGDEAEVLLGQNYSPEDDIAFATSLEKAMRDTRYIRVDGRPLLMLYRPGLLPDPVATVARWREHFRKVGIGEIYVVMPQAFGVDNPRAYGMDAAAGFPPHRSGFDGVRVEQQLAGRDPAFHGSVGDYEDMIGQWAANDPQDFRLLPGVCPDWDNEARRPNRGLSFINARPQAYGDWLAAACERAGQASSADERIVFINAWNEWAEGAYLEPDRHHGHAYLAETSQVLHDLRDPERMAARQARLCETLVRANVPRAAGLGRRMARKAARVAEAMAVLLRSL